MTKAKTNALDALRALIAERQQYEQWMATLESKRSATPEQVFERVQADYQARLQRVIGDIRGYSEELQLSISTLSSRLVEVARDEDTRREGLQEAELRAAVGEYEADQWEQLRSEAERGIEKTAADRASLDSQLAELRAIQKLSEVGSTGSPDSVPSASPGEPSGEARDAAWLAAATTAPPAADGSASGERPPAAAGHRAGTAAVRQQPPAAPFVPPAEAETRTTVPPKTPQERFPLEPVAAAASAAPRPTPPRGRTPPGGTSSVKSKSEPARPDQAKTLKCPECGTPNYPTEWYCERCGGELATM